MRLKLELVILFLTAGCGTRAALLVLRDNICVSTIPALSQARRHLDKRGVRSIPLIAAEELRVPGDFAKALALGADAVAVSNAVLQAKIGCLGMRSLSYEQLLRWYCYRERTS